MTGKTNNVQRTEQVGGALGVIEDSKAKAMQHTLADAVIARERASAEVDETSASLRAIRSNKPASVADVASAALVLAAFASGKRASEIRATVATEMAAGFSQPDAVCSAISLLSGSPAEYLSHLVRKAEKTSADYEATLAKASTKVNHAQEELRTSELTVQKILKEAELLVHTLAPQGSQARNMIKRAYTRHSKPSQAVAVPQAPAPTKAAA